MTKLTCNHLNLGIGDIQVVSDFNLELTPGSLWGLLGSNGAGKTTLLKCMAGLLRPQGGAILLESRAMDELPRKALARRVGMLQQHTAYVFDSSVMQIALTGRHPHLGHWQREGPGDFDKALTALKDVGLDQFRDRSVTGLSGGEARRLAFAALLVQETDIMLLDEPTNHLDLRHQIQVMNMIRNRTVTNGAAAIAALHDVNLAARYCTHVLMLFGQGQWCAGTTAQMLNETSLQRLYGCAVEELKGKEGPRFYPLPAE